MQNFENKNYKQSFIKLFTVFWLVFISLIPYLLASLALMQIDFNLGLMLFDNLFNFVGFSISLLMIFLLFKKRFFEASSLKKFIASNARRVFWLGVIIFYLIVILSVVISRSNVVSAVMDLIFSFIALPITFLFLKIGQKNINIIKELSEKEKLT